MHACMHTAVALWPGNASAHSGCIQEGVFGRGRGDVTRDGLVCLKPYPCALNAPPVARSHSVSTPIGCHARSRCSGRLHDCLQREQGNFQLQRLGAGMARRSHSRAICNGEHIHFKSNCHGLEKGSVERARTIVPI